MVPSTTGIDLCTVHVYGLSDGTAGLEVRDRLRANGCSPILNQGLLVKQIGETSVKTGGAQVQAVQVGAITGKEDGVCFKFVFSLYFATRNCFVFSGFDLSLPLRLQEERLTLNLCSGSYLKKIELARLLEKVGKIN
jgi:hypothetical protein